jgi:hypothetical protein
MKRIPIALLMILVIPILLTTSCCIVTGSGNPITDTFDYSDFTELEIHNGFQVEVEKSSNFSIEITIDDNLQEELVVEKSDSNLIIRLQDLKVYSSVTLIARVTMPDISRLDLSGGSQANVTGFDLSHDLSLGMSGGSRIDGDISADDVDIDMSGGSRIELDGVADNLQADASGGSRLELGSFSVGNADIQISGGGRATINASGTLDLDLSGGSHVSYYGEPTIGSTDLSGGSTYTKK